MADRQTTVWATALVVQHLRMPGLLKAQTCRKIHIENIGRLCVLFIHSAPTFTLPSFLDAPALTQTSFKVSATVTSVRYLAIQSAMKRKAKAAAEKSFYALPLRNARQKQSSFQSKIRCEYEHTIKAYVKCRHLGQLVCIGCKFLSQRALPHLVK